MRTLSLTYGPTLAFFHFRRLLCSSRAMRSNHHLLLALQSINHSLAGARVSSFLTISAVIQFHSVSTCYAFLSDGDGNGEFETNFHVITVARLNMSISSDSLLDENYDSVEGKGLFCCYFAFCIPGPNTTYWFVVCVAWLVQVCVLKRIILIGTYGRHEDLFFLRIYLGECYHARPRRLKHHSFKIVNVFIGVSAP